MKPFASAVRTGPGSMQGDPNAGPIVKILLLPTQASTIKWRS